MSASSRTVFAMTGLIALLATLLAVAPPASGDVSDTIQVVKEGETLSNVEIVARLAEETFNGSTPRVLIGRENDFADSMASAVMQHDSPLMLVPTDGPVPQRVRDLLVRYDPQEVVLLGGEQAIGPAVEQELAQDYAVTRRQGPTRFETAIDIAVNEAPEADTAILARGFGDPDADDESQSFADALAAGGWAAETGWPMLLTPTDRLPDSLEAYLDGSQVEQMMIMGGTAAISQEVEDRLRARGIDTTRVAGVDRFATAIAVAAMRGTDSAADADRVVLVEGQADNAWAAGFAAAGHSAAFDAPVVLANGEGLPPATEDYFSGETAFAQDDGFFDEAVLTCAALPSACEAARVAQGLPPQVTVAFTPPSGSTIDSGTRVTVQYTGGPGGLTAEVSGDCIPNTLASVPGVARPLVDPGYQGECTITSTIDLGPGSTQVDAATYTVVPVGGQSGIVTATTQTGYQWVPGPLEELVAYGQDDTFSIEGTPATADAFQAQIDVADFVSETVTAFAQVDAPVNHDLTNREPTDYTAGLVGNVNLPDEEIAIIEPVSGVELRPIGYAGLTYEVDGALASQTTFEDDVNEGDQLIVLQDGSGIPTRLQLTNDTISGPLTLLDAGPTSATFRIDSGGLDGSPLIGDTVTAHLDPNFEVFDDPSIELLVNGDPSDIDGFLAAANNGDQVTYERQDLVERFSLVDDAPPSGVTRATETFSLVGTTSPPRTGTCTSSCPARRVT